MSKCIGCGVALQNTDSNLPGYVNDLSYKYCERCFRNINYSEIRDNELDITNEDIVKMINLKSELTFFVIDFFNISNDVIDIYNQIKTPKYLVVNKMDVIPKSINNNIIINLLKKVYHITDEIIFTSVKESNLKEYFGDYKNIYFCGITNSGKTSLISKTTSNNYITKSSMINTTQDYLIIYYEDYNIVDTPGFIIDTNPILSKYQKLINPSKVIKVRNYQVKEETTLNIHNLIRITFKDSNNVSCYISNGLLVTKEYQSVEDYKEIEIPDNSDLIIKGIGFLNIKNKGIIKIPKTLVYEIRESVF